MTVKEPNFLKVGANTEIHALYHQVSVLQSPAVCPEAKMAHQDQGLGSGSKIIIWSDIFREKVSVFS